MLWDPSNQTTLPNYNFYGVLVKKTSKLGNSNYLSLVESRYFLDQYPYNKMLHEGGQKFHFSHLLIYVEANDILLLKNSSKFCHSTWKNFMNNIFNYRKNYHKV